MYEQMALNLVGRLNKVLDNPKFSFINPPAKNVLRETPGYYFILSRDNVVIYVGRSTRLRGRLLSDHRRGSIEGSQFRKASMKYFNLKDEEAISKFILNECSFIFQEENSLEERIVMEHFTTAILRPVLNMKLEM